MFCHQIQHYCCSQKSHFQFLSIHVQSEILLQQVAHKYQPKKHKHEMKQRIELFFYSWAKECSYLGILNMLDRDWWKVVDWNASWCSAVTAVGYCRATVAPCPCCWAPQRRPAAASLHEHGATRSGVDDRSRPPLLLTRRALACNTRPSG